MEEDGQTDIAPPQKLLWLSLQNNPAFDGQVAEEGSRFLGTYEYSSKQFEGMLQTVLTNLDFLNGMASTIGHSSFALEELKTAPEGVSLYLCLPEDDLATHSRWLRLMIALINSVLQRTKGPPAATAC